MSVPRRSIEELRIRYDLEPGLRDIFVEGAYDCDVLEAHFRRTGEVGPSAYEIDTVDIEAALLMGHRLTEGRKQRVIVLARALSGLPSECAFRCVVDRDLDHWFGSLESTPRLRWTAHASLELYFLRSDLVQELLVCVAKARISNWDEFYGSFVRTLQSLYAARVAARALGLQLQWIPFERFLRVEQCAIECDIETFASRVLAKNGRAACLSDWLERISTWQATIAGDPQGSIRGHDMVKLMAWSVRQFKGEKSLADDEALRRVLIAFVHRVEGLELLVA